MRDLHPLISSVGFFCFPAGFIMFTLLRQCTAFMLSALAFALPAVAQSQSSLREEPKPDTWYLENSMVGLDAAGRFVSGLIVSNPGTATVYVRTSLESVSVVDNIRKRSPAEGVLRVYPEEFVLRPGDSFTARLVADPSKISTEAQSFYVKFADISNTKPDAKASGGFQNAYLLAFEALVTVNKTAVPKLGPEQFALGRDGSDYTLKNLSGHHLYLDRGGLCPASKPLMVECKAFVNFPRQTFMPNETVKFSVSPDDVSDTTSPYVGILVYSGLNQRDRTTSIYLPVVPAR